LNYGLQIIQADAECSLWDGYASQPNIYQKQLSIIDNSLIDSSYQDRCCHSGPVVVRSSIPRKEGIVHWSRHVRDWTI